jgi:hypothetical protein
VCVCVGEVYGSELKRHKKIGAFVVFVGLLFVSVCIFTEERGRYCESVLHGFQCHGDV